MFIRNRGYSLRSNIVGVCRRHLSAQSLPAVRALELSDEYTEKPEYPEILDLSLEARKARESVAWHDEIQKVKTVEEKLIKINMPRYYGYKTVMLSDSRVPYGCLSASQHYTRTVFNEDLKLEDAKSEPEKDSKPKQEALVEAVRNELKDSLEYLHDFFRQQYSDCELDPQMREKLLGQLTVEQVNRTLVNSLSADYSHLNEIEIDLNPRHEAFWFVGGIDPPKNVVKSKEGRVWQKSMAYDPVDRPMQYTGQPYLAVRHRNPLQSFCSQAQSENAELAKSIPRHKYDPRTLGFLTDYRHGTNIPGFWPGSPSGFGLISYQCRDHMAVRNPSFGAEDFQETLHVLGIQSSFAWLLAQANYNGFSTFSDLTYPMNTQTIITNGRDWSFYQYQLNTTLIHSQHAVENPKVNFCRGTKELQLFQEIDASGKCVGFNDEVVRHLVQFYINTPIDQHLATSQLQPYLDNDVKKIADYPDADRRVFLERTFKHMSSNRPRHLELPEIYLWEKIYKTDHKTRPMEARRRFFELDINPWQRKMDQHAAEYIPKCNRPEGPKSRKKFKKTFYP